MMREWANLYLEILDRDYSGLNLTRIMEPEEFYVKQVEDALIPFRDCPALAKLIDNNSVVVDVGFGGGFPLLPLARLYPDKKFIGFEARGKKAKAVQDIANKMGLDNVQTYHQRVEEVNFDLDCMVTFKAVGTVMNFLPCVEGDSKINVLFYKGPNFFEKEKLDKKLRWKVKEKFHYHLEKSDGRLAILFSNQNVPRGTMKKKKVNLSSLI
jgi:16S rRNA (guanine527-N7)-methyltransferase